MKFTQNNWIKGFVLAIAIGAMAASVVYSQQKGQKKAKEKKQEEIELFNTSKSMVPPIQKEKSGNKSKSEKKELSNKASNKQEPSNTTNQKEEKLEKENPSDTSEKPKNKKKFKIMPSSKSPAID